MPDALRVAYVTAGGAGMFCGSCMRDNTLVAAVRKLGCDALLVPTFTPIRTDEPQVTEDRVFLGGINVYLEQKWPFMRRLPQPLRRALDSPRLLGLISKLALETRREEDAAVAVSLLRGEYGHQRAEIEDLVRWLANDIRPHVVNLTNLLISGFVPALKRQHDVPVLVTLQGDDVFLDALAPSGRHEVLSEMRNVAKTIDGFVVFSRYYRDFMASLLEVPLERFRLVSMGLADPGSFARPAGARGGDGKTIGYLARICPHKGFHVLVDAFLHLRTMPGTEGARLRAAGWLGQSDKVFFEEQRRKLAAAGALEAFEHVDVPDREDKIRFLHGLDVLSVPTIYREPKGIYVLEALAAGVPVVVPAHGAFPELLEATGGGRLVPPGDPERLGAALRELLLDPAARARLAEEGQRRVRERFDAESMARGTLEVWQDYARPVARPT
jgi:glycosyltransferase involved in cell wall biosynthesis